jgi:hypothetical protein
MPNWTPIEIVMLRGGPRDGGRLEGLKEEDLLESIDVPTGSGSIARYRISDEYTQLRGVHMAEPYSREWFYDWVPEG